MEEEKIEKLESKKEKKSKKKIVILSIILGIAVITAIVFIILFFMKPKYELKINTDGRKITKQIEIKDNVIKKLPEVELKEGEVFSAWVNKDGEAMRPNLKLTRDDEITPIIITPQPKEEIKDPVVDIVTLKFVSGTDEKIPDIKIAKGSKIILPVKPTHDEWKFLYWVDKDGYVVLSDMIVKEDMTIYAYWWKPTKTEVTISFDTGTDEKVDDITIPKGSKIIFPTLSITKENSVFKGWVDEDGKLLDGTYKVERDIKLTANWQPAYTCPEGCTPNADGKTCTKEETSEMITYYQCPEGYINIDNQCLDTKRQYYSEHIDHDPWWTCSNPNDGMYDEVEYMGAIKWCAPKANFEVMKDCPEDLKPDGDVCKKTVTIECTPN